MRTKLLIMSIFTSLCSLLSSAQESNTFRSVSVDGFAKVIADTSVVRLDVRTPEEYAEGHIAGALNIDVKAADFKDKALGQLPKDKTIAVYCRSGRRSKQAASILSANGYTVVELDTGILGWIDSACEVVE